MKSLLKDKEVNISYGVWRLEGLSVNTVLENLETCKELNINLIDTANIYHLKEYGDSERLIGEALNLKPELKKHFKVITKCGILAGAASPDFPHYNNDKEYIISCAKESLNNLKIDCIDVLLLHRPDIFMDFNEIYEAFKYLKDNNIVKEFGVSNFTPLQFKSLYKYLNKRGIKLVTNQIELSLYCNEHILNDNTFYLKGEEISPMIWSPLGGGELFKDNDTNKLALELCDKYNCDLSQLGISYLNSQGLNPIIVLGTQKKDRYIKACEKLNLKLEYRDMYKLYKSLVKHDVK